ncbi:MAG: hypothetical protein EXS08_07395 [Planctomycetes bacterium]|nr:hypothetical protein [Planctomycetota bacterium]
MSRLLAPLAAFCFFVPCTSSAQEPCFDGGGGPGGDFDWVVRAGEFFVFDTTATLIRGGPGGVPVTTESCIDGVVDVRNLIVEAGGSIRVQGPNRMRIVATGEVVIRGTLDLSGFNARDVATLNTGQIVEIGAPGVAGGGRGGNANVNITGSTARGGRGQGPFLELDTGGQGGESALAPANLGKDVRRPGGGGGGRFARDQGSDSSGLAATAGNDGHPFGGGAESGLSPARGGAAGSGPFVDPKPSNDYFGIRPLVARPGQLIGLIRGELPGLLAGFGGGGGGNAIPASTFPNPNWNFSSDEKGGAGGGGGGALHVQALGRIVFGAQGQILCQGGRGGTGENTNFLDHIGGTGGAGSGGHVVLESASAVDFTDGGTNLGAPPRDWISAKGQPKKTGPLSDVNACCRSYSNGGAGGPGVVQLHVPNPVAPPGTNPARTDIVVPTAVATARFPLDLVASPSAVALFPTCDPFARLGLGWFGAAGAGARAGFMRLKLEGTELPDTEPLPSLLGLDLRRLLQPMRH